ncbi:hypothetical protein [Desulfovibrio litoralis]|uniref:Uncharacterized protein n=1 Tax=Desulfovibrio litoralis DSM 11393 TaxID=1121455 RepID=A0A1M7T7Q1_9BACT|nr:hypothetical protein [Desulfovibrio litoralis]SHN66761.1 hypothetical protein SAMN02745728_01688 [Desulfovibrio litoralis DSM 11393]
MLPATKINEINEPLFECFINLDTLTEVQIYKYNQEIDKLAKANKEGALLAHALLCAIQNKNEEAVNAVMSVVNIANHKASFLNSMKILRHLGRMYKLHEVACLGFKKYPTDKVIINDVIESSLATEDAVTLELALEHWHKLFNQPHPSELIFYLEEKIANETKATKQEPEEIDEALGQVLNLSENNLFESAILSKRMKKLAQDLADEINCDD